MKKESLLVGIVGLLIGGLLGYVVGSQVTWRQMQRQSSDHSHDHDSQRSQAGGNPALPEGHPRIPSHTELEALKKAVEAAPDNRALVTDLANKLYDAAKYQEAVPYYQRALAMDPSNVSVSTDLGTALFYSGKADEAIRQYNTSLQINPNHPQTLHNLVIVNLQGKNDPQAATEALNRLISVDPGNPSIPNLRQMLADIGESKPNPRRRIF